MNGLEELRQEIGRLAYTPPQSGRRKKAIDLILDHVEAQNGEALLLQWLLSYIDDPAMLQAGMRIVQQPEPAQLREPIASHEERNDFQCTELKSQYS